MHSVDSLKASRHAQVKGHKAIRFCRSCNVVREDLTEMKEEHLKLCVNKRSSAQIQRRLKRIYAKLKEDDDRFTGVTVRGIRKRKEVKAFVFNKTRREALCTELGLSLTPRYPWDNIIEAPLCLPAEPYHTESSVRW